MNDLATAASVELQPFERGRRNLLAVPLLVAPGVQAVIELFDKTAGTFRPEDLQDVRAAAEVGTELLRQALGHRQAQQMLLNAVEAALGATDKMDQSLHDAGVQPREAPPPEQVLDQLRAGLSDLGHKPGNGLIRAVALLRIGVRADHQVVGIRCTGDNYVS